MSSLSDKIRIFRSGEDIQEALSTKDVREAVKELKDVIEYIDKNMEKDPSIFNEGIYFYLTQRIRDIFGEKLTK